MSDTTSPGPCGHLLQFLLSGNSDLLVHIPIAREQRHIELTKQEIHYKRKGYIYLLCTIELRCVQLRPGVYTPPEVCTHRGLLNQIRGQGCPRAGDLILLWSRSSWFFCVRVLRTACVIDSAYTIIYIIWECQEAKRKLAREPTGSVDPEMVSFRRCLQPQPPIPCYFSTFRHTQNTYDELLA